MHFEKKGEYNTPGIFKLYSIDKDSFFGIIAVVNESTSTELKELITFNELLGYSLFGKHMGKRQVEI